jgi:hypothetical protein
MSKKDLVDSLEGLESEVLDHAKDFVACVQQGAPEQYRRLAGSEQAERLLQLANFNHGKLFCYAEFIVFRREFLTRFPEASRSACINAFSALFLKNDVSISNLLLLMEGSDELSLLQNKGMK